jgi:hypothetical protein
MRDVIFCDLHTRAMTASGRTRQTEPRNQPEEILAALRRLEGELAELKQHVVGSPEPPASPSGTARTT